VGGEGGGGVIPVIPMPEALSFAESRRQKYETANMRSCSGMGSGAL
jgi:hypothetical protein